MELRMSIPHFVYGAWALVIILALTLASFAAVAGWRKRRTLVYWRWVKLGSAILGFIGLFTLLLQFETATRALILEKARDELLLNYIETKSFISVTMAATCSEPAEITHDKNTCWDMKNADGLLSIESSRIGLHFDPIKNWQNNPAINEFVQQVNERIEYMNSLMPPEQDRYRVISDEQRPFVLLFVAGLLAFALSGAIGEAAFQLRDAMDAPPKT